MVAHTADWPAIAAGCLSPFGWQFRHRLGFVSFFMSHDPL